MILQMRMWMNALRKRRGKQVRETERMDHRRTTFGAKRKSFFGFSNTATSISTSFSSPSTIFLTIRISFFGGSCMIGYVGTLSYDQARAGLQVSKGYKR